MPTFDPAQLSTFVSLFMGRHSAYGLHIPDPEVKPGDKGKKKGISTTIREICSESKYADHLAGKISLGVVPIMETDACMFGAIDIDDYEGDKSKLVSNLYRMSMPFLPFQSKSGGIHLFIFFEEAIAANKLIAILKRFRSIFGLPSSAKNGKKATEIFPKQETTSADKVGNWINLPYYGDSDRKLVSPAGTLVEFSSALKLMVGVRTTEESVKRYLDSLLFSDGPPCLETLNFQQVTANRNTYLFSVARYMKTKYGADDFEQRVLDVNNALPEPLAEAEAESTFLASLRKQDYSYKCKESPLIDFCDKRECCLREFGLGGGMVSDLSYGQMTQVLAEPPYYLWEINGKNFTFFDEDELIKQNVFQRQAVRLLHFLPYPMKNAEWIKVVNNALSNIVTKGVDAASSIDSGSIFKKLLTEFLSDRSQATSYAQLVRGKPYKETLPDGTFRYLFTAQKLIEFLDLKRFTKYRLPEMMEKIRSMGGSQERIYIDASIPNFSVLSLPQAALSDFIVSEKTLDASRNLDFLEEVSEF